MDWIKNISLVVLGGLAVLFYWKGCSPCPEIGEVKTEVQYLPGEVVTVVDSMWFNKYHELIDRIPEEKPLYSKKVPKRIIKQIKKDSANGVKSKIRRFTTPFEDRTRNYTIKGEITSLSECEILSMDVQCDVKSLFVKKNEFRVDTIRSVETNYVIKNSLWIGAESSIGPFGKQFSGTLDFLHKKGFGIGYRFEHNFDLPVNNSNSHHIKITKQIF